MNSADDERLQELMQQMTEIPFSDDLKQRILEKASSVSQKPKKSKRRLGGTFRYGAASAGLVAAAALVLVALNRPEKTQSNFHSSTASSQQNQEVAAYGMMKAPLQIQDLHLGEESGYPNQSEVVATLVNETSSTIHASDVFGVLAFSKNATLQNLAAADWLSFVNGPAQNESIPPHESIKWIFHPVGAPHTKSLALSETPHLMFYKSQMVNSEKADVVWQKSSLKVTNASVVLNTRIQTQITNGQSIIVDADIRNPLSKPVDLSSQLCFIWFDHNGNNQFTNFGVMRFISHVSAGTGDKKLLLPGETVHAAFHLIGSAEDKYFTTAVHLAIVGSP
jgi:hypothetical protein